MKKYIFNTPAILILIIVGIILRILVADSTGLGVGEAYYFGGVHNLQLSYFDQPPLFLWLGYLAVKILGLSTFSLRIFSILLFAGTTYLIYLITTYIFNNRAGLYAAIVLNISVVFTIPVATWLQPDAPLMFFWLLYVYCIVILFFPKNDLDVNSERKSNRSYLLWIIAGISLGLASLAKYHAIFLFLGTFIFTIVNKQYRHWFRHPGPYLALIIYILILLPVIIWNYKNDWISFVFQGSRVDGGINFSLHPDWLLRNMLGQMLWLAPWIWVPLILELFLSFRKSVGQPVYSLIIWLSVFPILFFTIITLWSNTQFHFHWQAPGYLILFIPLGDSIANKISLGGKKRKKVRNWLVVSSLFVVGFSTVLILHMNTGFWQNYGPRWISRQVNGDYDPTIEGIDYDEIYERFSREDWLDEDSLFVGSVRWWQVGKIDWALKGQKEMIVFHHDPRNYAYFSDPEKLLGYDAIIIKYAGSGKLEEEVCFFFDEVNRLDDIDIKRRNITELVLEVYFCKNFKNPVQPIDNMPVYNQINGLPPF